MFIQGLQAIWRFPHVTNLQEISELATTLNISIPVAQILHQRNYKTKKEALDFLFPHFDETYYNAHLLHDCEKAIMRIEKAIISKEKILIAGDYDVDGISSTALLLYALKDFGAHVNFFLPHRVHDGYGLSEKTILKAKKADYSLVITVDNGTSAFTALKEAKNQNIDVIVTDHHQPKDIPEGAFCIVNPHLPYCSYPFKDLAGVGVIFKIVLELYKRKQKPIPEKIYELFLFGTVADVMPLIKENRYWVSYALSKINQNISPSIALLKINAKITPEKKLTAEDIAFSLAPQLNALGRLSDPRNGVLFFIHDNHEGQEQIALELLERNIERRKTEKEILKHLLFDIEKEQINPKKDGCIIKASKEFLPGIIGLLAAKLTQLFQVPSCIFSENNEEGILKGSCRSIPACNIFKVLENIQKNHENLLLSFGGHHAAAGVAIDKKNLERFKTVFSQEVFKQCSEDDFTLCIDVDAKIHLDEINQTLWKDLHLLEPFGAQNKTPIFYIQQATVLEVKIIKEIHVKLKIISGEKKISVLFFDRTDIINIIDTNKKIDLIAKIKENTWQNKSTLELLGIDLKIISF
jgi:single-stranded-DNA-specific exonuclease